MNSAPNKRNITQNLIQIDEYITQRGGTKIYKKKHKFSPRTNLISLISDFNWINREKNKIKIYITNKYKKSIWNDFLESKGMIIPSRGPLTKIKVCR